MAVTVPSLGPQTDIEGGAVVGDVDREIFMEDGCLVLRGVVSTDELNQLRTSYEVLLERQKEIWAAGRGPDDPPGGPWDSAPQSRVQLFSWDDQEGVTGSRFLELWPALHRYQTRKPPIHLELCSSGRRKVVGWDPGVGRVAQEIGSSP